MKHRQTKATDISPEVRRKVEARDSFHGRPCCIFCGSPYADGNAHFISRAHGGLGIEENLLTLCPLCHADFDGPRRKEMRPMLKRYLMSKYPDWDESKLVYHKYGA